MILLLTISNILFIIILLVISFLYLKLRKNHMSCIDDIDKDIERAEKILNSIIIRIKHK